MGELGEFKAFIGEMNDKLKDDKERNAINNHYGMNEAKFREMVANTMSVVFKHESKSESLDELFPKLDATGRLQVEAYYIARKMIRGM